MSVLQGDIFQSREELMERLIVAKAENAKLKARCDRLKSGAELAWYELGRLLGKWQEDWSTGDIEAVESVIRSLKAALADEEGT